MIMHAVPVFLLCFFGFNLSGVVCDDRRPEIFIEEITTSTVIVSWNQDNDSAWEDEALMVKIYENKGNFSDTSRIQLGNTTKFDDLQSGTEYIVEVSLSNSEGDILYKALIATARCPDGWIGFQSSCYMRMANNVRHGDAVQECQTISPNAHLADPRTTDEYGFITGPQILPLGSWNRVYWIGIKVTSDGEATYSDGSPVTEELNRFRGSDDEDDYECVALNPTGEWEWRRTQCVVNAHFICQYPVPLPPRGVSVGLREGGAFAEWERPELSNLSSSTNLVLELREETPLGNTTFSDELELSVTKHDLIDLKSGSPYYLSLYSEEPHAAKSAKYPDTLFITTPPTVYISEVQATYSSLSVVWNIIASDDDTFHNFVIEYRESNETDSDDKSVLVVQDFNTTIVGLKPFTKYIVSVFSSVTYDTWYSNETRRSSLSNSSQKELQTSVSPVFNLRVNQATLSETQFDVEWDPAVGEIDEYRLTVEAQSGDQSNYNVTIEKSRTRATVNNLAPATRYFIRVIAARQNTTSRSVLMEQTTRPLPLTNFQAILSKKTIDSVSFEMSRSWTGRNDFDEYRVVFSDITDEDILLEKKFDRDLKTITFDGLTPGSTYTVSLYTVKNGVLSNPWKDERVVLQVAPPTNFTVLYQDEIALHLEWAAGAGDVTNFLVLCDHCPGEKTGVLDAEKENSYAVTDLQPGMLYTFSVQGFIVLESPDRITPPASDWESISVRTLPNAPGLVNITASNSTSQTLEWFSVDGHYDGYLIEYSLAYQPQMSTVPVFDGNIHVPRSNNSKVLVTVTDLVPGITYEAEVKTLAGTTGSFPSLVTMITDASALGDINLMAVYEDSAEIYWDAGVGGFQNFELEVSEVPAGEAILYSDIKNTTFVIDSLKAGTLYRVTLTKIAYPRKSLPVEMNIQTRPSPVSKVEIYDVAEKSFSVRWVPPKSPYTEFVVTLYDGDDENSKLITKTVTVSYVIFDDLEPGRKYSVVIESMISRDSTVGTGVRSEVTMYPLPPVGIISTGKTSNSLSASWMSPKGAVGSYHVTWQPGNGMENTTQPEISLEGLVPGVGYAITVYSRSEDNGRTSRSGEDIVIFTDEDYPKPPLNIRLNWINTNSALLGWDEPSEPNGVILAYEVYYEQVYPIRSPGVRLTVESVFADLVDLVPGSIYTVVVASENSKGIAGFSWSDEFIMQTEEDVPGPVDQLFVEATEKRSLNVSWKVPQNPNGEITLYQLDVLKESSGEVVRTVNFYRDMSVHPLKCFEYKSETVENIFADVVLQNNTIDGPFFEAFCDVATHINNLQPYTTYQVNVKAFTAVGGGKVASTSYTTMEEVPSGPPRNITVIDCGPTFVKLSWEPPEFPNGLLTYTLNMFAEGSITTSDTVYEISNLTAYHVIAINLMSVTNAGISESTPWLLLNTTEGVPTAPQSLTGKVMNSESVYLTWQQPDNPKGIIISYNVAIYDDEGSPVQVDKVDVGDANITGIMPDLKAETALNYNIPIGNDTLLQDIIGSKIPEFLHDMITHVVKDLTPYTEYRFEVNGVTSAGYGIPAAVTFRTHEDRPGSSPTNLIYTNLTSTSVYLNWLEPKDPNGEIISYSVMYIYKLNEMRTKVTNRTEVVLENLLKNSPYSVFVNSKTAAGEGPSSARLQMYTEEDVPDSPPIDLKYFNVTPSIIRLQWSPPKIPNGIIQHYTVYYRNNSGEFSVNSRQPETHLTDLKVYGEYTIQIAASTRFGSGGLRSLPLYVRTGEGQPGTPPHNLTYENITATEVNLIWHEPLEPNGVITHYEIHIESESIDGDENVITPDASTEFLLDVLRPDSEYTINIRAHTKFGDGGQISMPLNIRTLEGVPGSPPTNIEYQNITSSEILLLWDDPEIRNGKLTGFKVYDRRASFTLTNYSIHLSDLDPFTTYSIAVSALTAAGEGPNGTILAYTKEDVPGSAVRNLNYTQSSPTEVLLSWLPPLVPNGVIVEYMITNEGDLDYGVFFTNSTNILLTGLQKHSTYMATVQSSTKVGYGDEVASVTFKTLQDAPGDPPRNVIASATGPTSIEVSWDPPTQPNGDIQYYTVYLKDNGGNGPIKQVFDGTSVVIDGLMKYTWYNVTITGSTSLGDGGHISKAARVQTRPGVPESGVENLHVVNMTSTTVELAWSEPSIKTGEFYYTLDVFGENGRHMSFNVDWDAPVVLYEITDLSPFVSYDVTVIPSVIDHDEPGPSTSLRFVTLEASPSQPVTDLEVLEIAYDSFTISWKPSPEPNGIITSYNINLNEEPLMDFDPSVWLRNDLFEVAVVDLHPDKMYIIKVTPVNAAGRGPPAELMINTTSGIPEDPPRNVKITNIEEHKATVLWNAPLRTNADVISYKVLYNMADKNATMLDGSPKWETLEVDGSKRNITLHNLEAFTEYTVTIASGTKYGYGPTSEKSMFKTLEARPSAPVLTCKALPDWNIKMSWLEPIKPNGILTKYSLRYQRFDGLGKTFQKYINSSMSYTITDVTPFTMYGAEVTAENGAGYGETANCSVLTPEGKPSAPLSFTLIGVTDTTITFEWKPPIQLNGVLLHYVIHYKPGYSCWANGGDLYDPAGEQLCVVKTEQLSKALLALESYSEYAVRIGAVTGGGLGELTSEISFRTETGVPDFPPTNVQAHMLSSTAINITWEPPSFFAGPTWYQAIAYIEDVRVAESDDVENRVFSTVIDELKPDTLYFISVLAKTSAGSMESKKTFVTTDEDAPTDPPSKLEVLTEDGNTSAVTVQFLPPNEPNGPLFKYTLEYKLGKDGAVTSMDILEENLPYSDEAIMLQNITITNLLGGRGYYFRMNAATIVGTGPWTNWTGPIILPVLAPPLLPVTLDVQPPEATQSQSTTSLEIGLCLFSEVNGPISNVTVIIVEDGGKLEVAPVYWFQAYDKIPSPPYVVSATEEYGSLCHNGGIKKRSVSSPSSIFVVGSDEACQGKEIPYCNGPLKSNTAYRLKVRGTTSNGDYTDTEFSRPVKTHPTFLQANLYLLIGLIAGFGLLLFVVSAVTYCVRRRLRSRSLNEPQQSRHSSLNKRASSGGVKSPSPVDNLSFVMEATDPNSIKSLSRPVPKPSFVTHVARMSEHNNKGFLSEFEEICSIAPSGPKNIGSQSFNAGKNRFIDIIPYDHYRVKIEDISSIEGSGYINASYIPGRHSPEQYIATQSPLANTKNEFWRMVWETGCQTLIMLCNVEQDGNEEKISKYWPNLTQTCYYGNLGVQCSLEEKKPEWTVRTFIVAKRDQRRQVTQYHFTLWPLRGVPDNPQAFIRFFQATRRGVRSSAGQPVIVMCSSGSGQSGVFIAYDMIVDSLAKENTVDPCHMVSELRNYRPLMVQTMAEYSFLHKCLAYSISKCSVRSPTGDGMEETTMF